MRPEPQMSRTGDGSKAVAKRKLQQPRMSFAKAQQEQPSQEGQAETSGSNEPEAASPIVVPKVGPCTNAACVLTACSAPYVQEQ